MSRFDIRFVCQTLIRFDRNRNDRGIATIVCNNGKEAVILVSFTEYRVQHTFSAVISK